MKRLIDRAILGLTEAVRSLRRSPADSGLPPSDVLLCPRVVQGRLMVVATERGKGRRRRVGTPRRREAPRPAPVSAIEPAA